MYGINGIASHAPSVRLWPSLAASLLAIVWLQPHHLPPWSGFHEDAGAAVWFALGGLVLTLLSLRRWQWSWPPVILFALSLTVAAQAFVGQITSSAQALLFIGHVWACAVVWVIAETWSRNDPQLLLDILFLAIGIACIGNVAIALFQWLQVMPRDILSTAGVWLMDVGAAARAVGNVAQPNELAMMINWAILGGVWAMQRGQIRWPVFLLYGSFLVLGLALTQSRAGMLNLFVLTLGLAVFKRILSGWQPAVLLGILSATLVMTFLALPWILDAVGLSHNVRSLDDAVSKDVARLQIYQMALEAIELSPWWGYGAQHLAIPQWMVLDTQPWLRAYYMQAHNWVLDLILWFGIPIGLSATAAIVFSFWVAFRKTQQPRDVVVLLALLCFVLYASVELPHWTTNLLLPAVALAGCLAASFRLRTVWQSGLVFNAAVMLVLSSILTLIVVDYVKLERNFIQLRAEQLRLRTDISEVPQAWVLSHLAESYRLSRTRAAPDMSPDDLTWYDKTVQSQPNNQTIFQYILALGLNDRHPLARLWMRRLNSVSPKGYQDNYVRIWAIQQTLYPKQLAQLAWDTREK